MRVRTALLALLLAPAVAAAAHPTVTQETRVTRVLAVSGLAFNGRWAPDVPTAGVVWQLSLATTKVTRDAQGEHVAAPSLFLHASALAGVNLFSSPHAVGLGALGLVARRQWPAVTSAGVVAVGAIPQQRLGPALRVELFDLLGLQAGALFHAGRAYAFVSIDAMSGLLGDVGLVP